jgi:hypothetical protein
MTISKERENVGKHSFIQSTVSGAKEKRVLAFLALRRCPPPRSPTVRYRTHKKYSSCIYLSIVES